MSERDPEPNIYAPPRENAELPIAVRSLGDGVWRERGLAVAERSGAIFPDRCVVCNHPGAERLPLTLRWHPEWVYAFTVLGFLPYVALVLVLGKTALVEISLCHLHAGRRRTGLLAGFAGVPVSLAICALGLWLDVETLVYLGVGGLLTGLLLGLIWGRPLRIGRMDDRLVSLSTGRPFLDSLPSRDGWGSHPGGYYPGSSGGPRA